MRARWVQIQRPVATFALVVLMMPAGRPARASIFGEETAVLTYLAGLELKEVVMLTQLVANGKLVLAGINDMAAQVRAAYRVYAMLKKYSVKELVRDAKRGLYAAMPELRDIESELTQLRGNMDAVEHGRFLHHLDHHDERMDRVSQAAFRNAMRATIWPVVFGDALNPNAESRTQLDDLILSRYRMAGMQRRQALQDTALGVLIQKASMLVDDAEAKGRADLMAQALEAQLGAQNVSNSTRLRDLAEQEAALRQHSAQQTRSFDQRARRSLARQAGSLLRPAGVVR